MTRLSAFLAGILAGLAFNRFDKLVRDAEALLALADAARVEAIKIITAARR